LDTHQTGFAMAQTRLTPVRRARLAKFPPDFPRRTSPMVRPGRPTEQGQRLLRFRPACVVRVRLDPKHRATLRQHDAGRNRQPPAVITVECRQIDTAARIDLDQVIGQPHGNAVRLGHLVAGVK
jgi:hypothetical protein